MRLSHRHLLLHVGVTRREVLPGILRQACTSNWYMLGLVHALPIQVSSGSFSLRVSPVAPARSEAWHHCFVWLSTWMR